MIYINARWRISAAALAAAACLAGCNSGNGGTVPPPTVTPPAAQTVDFSAFAEKAFAPNANSTPVSLDGVTFTFDVNDDAGAFDSLVMSGTFQ